MSVDDAAATGKDHFEDGLQCHFVGRDGLKDFDKSPTVKPTSAPHLRRVIFGCADV
jgi:hypothetical protein